jgi:hypothetical protein
MDSNLFPFDVAERKKKIVEHKWVSFAIHNTGYCVEICTLNYGSLFLCDHEECPMHKQRLDGFLFDN